MSQVSETPDAKSVGPDKHVVAFLDIGTNSVRMLLARIDPNHSFSVISQQKEVVRLGEGEFRDRQLQPAAIRRAVLVCSQSSNHFSAFGLSGFCLSPTEH